ncbi:hypothetical protein Tdes44962_MAKER02400, partial [Teratosphaeria destructans]
HCRGVEGVAALEGWTWLQGPCAHVAIASSSFTSFPRLSTTSSPAIRTAADTLACHQQIMLRALSGISMLMGGLGAPLHHSEAEDRSTLSLLHHQPHLNILSEPSTDLRSTLMSDRGKTRACSTPQPPPTAVHCIFASRRAQLRMDISRLTTDYCAAATTRCNYVPTPGNRAPVGMFSGTRWHRRLGNSTVPCSINRKRRGHWHNSAS